MSKPSSSQGIGMSMGKLMFYVLVLSLGALMLYNYFWPGGGFGGALGSDYTAVPKEMQITYIPSDFQNDLDEETMLVVLANPHRYRREFNEMVYSFNMSMLGHVAKRMDLPDSLRSQVSVEYDKHHAYLRQLYFNDFVALSDTTGGIYQAWYNNENTNALEVFNEVASKYTCFLVNHVIMALVESEGGKLYVKGNKVDSPCGIALTEALRPMMKRLQDRASVLDFSRSKGMMEEKVEKVIAELATMEVRDKKAINKQLQTKIWGYSVSSTDIEVSAISMLKVGFKLDDYFKIDLNTKGKNVTITLPEPVILSHEVYPKVDKLDIGWMREVKEMDLNSNFNLLRSEFRRDALDSDIMEKAKVQVNELMEMMFMPVVSAYHKGYSIKIKYKKVGPVHPEFAKEEAPKQSTKNLDKTADIPF